MAIRFIFVLKGLITQKKKKKKCQWKIMILKYFSQAEKISCEIFEGNQSRKRTSFSSSAFCLTVVTNCLHFSEYQYYIIICLYWSLYKYNKWSFGKEGIFRFLPQIYYIFEVVIYICKCCHWNYSKKKLMDLIKNSYFVNIVILICKKEISCLLLLLTSNITVKFNFFLFPFLFTCHFVFEMQSLFN